MLDTLSVTLSALADPTRRAILARLTKGEATVNEIAKPFDISLPAVSRHLKVLERAGLISRGREAQWRPCRIEARGLKEVADWMEDYRQLGEVRLDRMQSYVERLHAEAKRSSKKKESDRNTAKARR